MSIVRRATVAAVLLCCRSEPRERPTRQDAALTPAQVPPLRAAQIPRPLRSLLPVPGERSRCPDPLLPMAGGGPILVERPLRARLVFEGLSVTDGAPVGDVEPLSRALRARTGGLRSCYERALRNNPTLEGRWRLEVAVDGTGQATVTGALSWPDPWREVEACVRGRIANVRIEGSAPRTYELALAFCIADYHPEL